jgi:hypothetical protein
MKNTLLNIITAIVLGLAFCAFVLHGLDALFY